jgi:hypothetical protein
MSSLIKQQRMDALKELETAAHDLFRGAHGARMSAGKDRRGRFTSTDEYDMNAYWKRLCLKWKAALDTYHGTDAVMRDAEPPPEPD